MISMFWQSLTLNYWQVMMNLQFLQFLIKVELLQGPMTITESVQRSIVHWSWLSCTYRLLSLQLIILNCDPLICLYYELFIDCVPWITKEKLVCFVFKLKIRQIFLLFMKGHRCGINCHSTPCGLQCTIFPSCLCLSGLVSLFATGWISILSFSSSFLKFINTVTHD